MGLVSFSDSKIFEILMNAPLAKTLCFAIPRTFASNGAVSLTMMLLDVNSALSVINDLNSIYIGTIRWPMPALDHSSTTDPIDKTAKVVGVNFAESYVLLIKVPGTLTIKKHTVRVAYRRHPAIFFDRLTFTPMQPAQQHVNLPVGEFMSGTQQSHDR